MSLATAVRLLPRRWRFKAAAIVARGFAPLVRRTARFQRRTLRIDGHRELALYLMLRTLVRNGTVFDATVRMEGEEILDAALAGGRGVLIIAPHSMLHLLTPGYLEKKGRSLTIIARSPDEPHSGSQVRILSPSLSFLFEVRNTLRRGCAVFAMIDNVEPGERVIEFTTVEGPVRISNALIHVGVRCDAAILFSSLRVDQRGRVIVSIAEPDPGARSTDSITDDFVTFVQRHVAAVRDTGSARLPAERRPVSSIPERSASAES